MLTEIPRMSLKELYNLYISTLYDFLEEEEYKDEYLIIRFGKNSKLEVEIDIFDIIEEEENIHGKAIFVDRSKQIVIYQKRDIHLSNYRTEKEKRRALLQKRLMEIYKDDNPFVSTLEDS